MNKFLRTIFFLSIVFMLGCTGKFDSSSIKTNILGHRAYGIKGFNDTLMDNTLPAVIKALQITNGVEVDIQMSKDGTIWLYHDAELLGKDSTIKFIPDLSDQEVVNWLTNIHPYTNFNTLEDLFKYYNENNINKYISLDIKSFYNEKYFKNNEELRSYMFKLGENVISLSKKYQLENQVLIESDIKFLLDYFVDNSNLKTFLLGFTEFNNHVKIARKKRYTGVSHHFSDPEINGASIDYAHKKKLKIQLWTPNSNSDLKSVLSLHPDFIQTDNVIFFKDSIAE